jgi:hypothetical protein
MRPSPEQLLASLRVSLNDTVLPNVTDRWARYVGTAMDLVLQHLQLRLAGEMTALQADNLDMSESLADLANRAMRRSAGPDADGGAWETLLARLSREATITDTPSLPAATESNESLRQQVVDVLRWLDETDPNDVDPELREIRDGVHQLIRRQVDRMNPMVEPLYMSFQPAVAR